ncbi:lipoate--protein ligase family protein [Salinirubellus salinus]|uniref:Lipoate--protein ligase family protein n=1 Tax=Salinirubellus salinus TaxID=1364945 RepID=A0A9E7R156_9EURY|nr:biotin/lipoate A/B protein ligase family protein [Salinirubellus salinus]UWM53617.1 lipoate--protein ligase family protein [Salinirubellus salinus]
MTDAGVDPNPAVADAEWRVVTEEVLDGATAMAYDEVAAETAANGGPRTVRVYQWLPSTLSLGYRQDADDVDWRFCEREGIDVVRRPTGGGAIYHDTHGDISYSIVAPADELPGDLMETYELLCEPVLAALRAAGVPADFAETEREAIFEPACFLRDVNPAHDVVTPEGKKVAGNAQHRTRDAVVQHGSFSFAPNPERHCSCFADCDVPVEQFEDRVASMEATIERTIETREYEGEDVGPLDSLAVSRDHAVRTLERSLAAWCDADEQGWTEAERERAREIADEKYRTEAWTRERDDPLA